MAREAVLEEKEKEKLTFGGMARWDGLDFFGPNYASIAYRRKGEIHVQIEPSRVWRPRSSLLKHLSSWPIIRSLFFWGRLILQVVGSVWTLLFFAVTLAILWLFVRLLEAGSGDGPLGGIFGFFAEFPVLPLLVVFLLAMKLTPVGRYHGAEHKSVAAYEEYGEVTLEGAEKSSRIHPRCGTNILIYILLAALLDPLVDWWAYAFLQFILISEAWYILGQTRPSIALGNFFQRYFTTSEPGRGELEVAVESLKQLLRAEERAGGEKLRAPIRS